MGFVCRRTRKYLKEVTKEGNIQLQSAFRSGNATSDKKVLIDDTIETEVRSF